jgi:hypothetical protein
VTLITASIHAKRHSETAKGTLKKRRRPMKKLTLSIAAMLLLAGFTIFPKNRMFTGEIMDSRCAMAGSHGSPVETSRECTLECVRAGARYVLYDPEKQLAYGLDNQRLPEGFAGDQVKVIGVYQPTTRSIHVFTIEPITEDAQLVNTH